MSKEEPLAVTPGWMDFELIPLERRIIALIVAGHTREESAQRLGISEPALRRHLVSIYDKLEVSNRLELILSALHHQLVVPGSDISPGQRSAPQ